MISADPGQQAVDFINCLSHPTSGKRFTLRPWQEGIVRKLIGTVDDSGQRVYSQAGIWLPRANGKTELAAAMILERFLRDRRPRRQFYCAATSRDQAKFLFNKVLAMLEDNERLRKLVDIRTSTHTIINQQTGSTFKAVSSESSAMHGSEPTMVVYDEIHVARDRELFTSLLTGMGKVDSPLLVTITTAGIYEKTTLEMEQYMYACRVRDGIVKDKSYLPVIYEAGPDDPWDKEETWFKCNPALGDFRSVDEMRRLAKQAKQITRMQNDFKRLYLNIHTAQTSRWLSQEQWLECKVDELDADGPWLGGCDLSAKQDLTSFGLSCKTEDGYAVKCWNWIPEETALAHEKSDRVPYLQWEKEGHVEFTPGDRIDQYFILDRIVEICKEHGVRSVAFDAHNAEWFFQTLPMHGIECKDATQNYKTYNEPCREFESCIASGTLQHLGNQCLDWQISCVEVKPTADKTLIRPVKSTQNSRIDGIVAILMSMALSKVGEQEAKPAIY